MNKQAPSTTQLLVIVGFALSCFGILLFLWITFGGPTPFKAKSYEVKIPFREATQLAQQSDVRISGISVGKVQNIEVSPDGRQSMATLHLDNKYGPIPANTRALLRTKTLLGETYVELTPGTAEGPILEDGGTLPVGNVAESVQLDELFRTFDRPTREAFRQWMQQSSTAIAGRGQDFSNVFAELEPTFEEFDRMFRVLDTQKHAVKQLFRNGAITFKALRGRQGQLADLIESTDRVFTTFGERDRDVEAMFRAFPTFEDEQRLTFQRLKEFAINTEPLMRQLVPAAEELSPTLVAFSNLAPQAKGFFEGFETVIDRSPSGFSSLRKLFRNEFPPLLRAIDPFLRNLNPLLTGLDIYRRELAATMGNVAAATNAVKINTQGQQSNYIRAAGPFGPEALATYFNRTTTNRNSAYSQPGAGERLARGLLSYDTRGCSSGITATLDPNTPTDPNFSERIEGKDEEDQAKKSQDFFDRLKKYAFAEQDNSASIPAPGCSPQAPFKSIYGSGASTIYQQTFEQGR